MNGSFDGAASASFAVALAVGAVMRTGIEPRVVCAWCGKTTKEGPLPPSHTICGECGRRLRNEAADRDAALRSGTAQIGQLSRSPFGASRRPCI